MSRRLSDDKLCALRAHFHAHPEPRTRSDFRAAADHAQCDWRVARRYFDSHFKQEIEQARTLARAKLTTDSLKAERDAAPLIAGDDAAAQIAREAMLARGASIEALALLSQIGKLRTVTKDLIARVEQEPASALSAGAALERLDAIGRLADRAVTLAAKSIQLERVRVGDPALVVGVKALPTETPSVAEVEAEVAAAARALQRVRATAQLREPIDDDDTAH